MTIWDFTKFNSGLILNRLIIVVIVGHWMAAPDLMTLLNWYGRGLSHGGSVKKYRAFNLQYTDKRDIQAVIMFRFQIQLWPEMILYFQLYDIGKTCECILNPQTTLPVKDIAFLCRSLIRFVPVWGRLVWPRRCWYGIQHRGRHLRCGNWNPSYGEVSFQMPIDYTLLLYRGFKLESGLTVFWNVLNVPKTTRCKDIISIFSCRLKPAIRFNKGGRRWWTDEIVFVQVKVQRCKNEAFNLKSMA